MVWALGKEPKEEPLWKPHHQPRHSQWAVGGADDCGVEGAGAAAKVFEQVGEEEGEEAGEGDGEGASAAGGVDERHGENREDAAGELAALFEEHQFATDVAAFGAAFGHRIGNGGGRGPRG